MGVKALKNNVDRPGWGIRIADADTADAPEDAGSQPQSEADDVHFRNLQRHLPNPAEQGDHVRFGNCTFRKWIEEDLDGMVRNANLLDPNEFHTIFFMGAAFLQSFDRIAEEQMVGKDTVKKWATGAITPPPIRRRGILMTMMAQLHELLRADPPLPPFRNFGPSDSGRLPKGLG